MNTAKSLPMLVCAFLAVMPTICLSEALTYTYFDESVTDTSLLGIKEIVPYVMIYCSEDEQMLQLSDNIEESIRKMLDDTGIKIGVYELNKALKSVIEQRMAKQNLKIRARLEIPELIVRIYAIRHQPTNSYVFNVQTSVARKVYTAQSVRSMTKAEVWRIDSSPSAVDANNFEIMLNSAVEEQVKRFIAEYKNANSGRAVGSETRSQRQNRPAPSSRDSKNAEQAAEDSQLEFISSKNSPVFHRSSCSSAARISSDNLITYKTAEEAVKSGKRPCKMCKP
ncbi:MAG: Ada metal-binding domain-containing protein [Phycisphaerae bacterium]